MNGKEGFECILGKRAEKLETRIAVALFGNRKQPPLPRDPAGKTFVQAEANLADLRRMRVIGGAQDELLAIEQINQAGVALHEFRDQVHNPLQDLLQTEVANHEPADFLEEPQLLFRASEPRFEVLLSLSHELPAPQRRNTFIIARQV